MRQSGDKDAEISVLLSHHLKYATLQGTRTLRLLVSTRLQESIKQSEERVQAWREQHIVAPKEHESRVLQLEVRPALPCSVANCWSSATRSNFKYSA